MINNTLLNDSCYIISHRDRSLNKDRTRNLLLSIKHIRSELNIPILVVEQDKVPNQNLKDILQKYNVSYKFLYNPNLFNRSWGYNCAVNIVKQTKLILADNDVILDNFLLKNSIYLLNQYDIIRPFNTMYELDEIETITYEKNNVLPNLISCKKRYGMTIFSAIIVMKKDAFLQMGGYDERFEGWGGEDDEMTIHLLKYLNKKELRYYQLNNSLIHMYHDRTIFDGKTQPNYKNNYSYIRDNNRNYNIKIGQINKYEHNK